MNIFSVLNPSKTRDGILANFKKAANDLLALANEEEEKAASAEYEAAEYEYKASECLRKSNSHLEEAKDCKAVAEKINGLIG